MSNNKVKVEPGRYYCVERPQRMPGGGVCILWIAKATGLPDKNGKFPAQLLPLDPLARKLFEGGKIQSGTCRENQVIEGVTKEKVSAILKESGLDPDAF